jgi:hypothetical protein
MAVTRPLALEKSTVFLSVSFRGMFDISPFADTEDIGVNPEKPVKDTACAAFISMKVDENHSMSFFSEKVHRT